MLKQFETTTERGKISFNGHIKKEVGKTAIKHNTLNNITFLISFGRADNFGNPDEKNLLMIRDVPRFNENCQILFIYDIDKFCL